ncbi:hypothetical protein WBK31_35570 [Nonomuraea sp. N2-4H]
MAPRFIVTARWARPARDRQALSDQVAGIWNSAVVKVLTAYLA